VNWLRRVFWSRCKVHGITYDSDFCPQCVRQMVVRVETRERAAGVRVVRPAPAVLRKG